VAEGNQQTEEINEIKMKDRNKENIGKYREGSKNKK
jgi:hypothetical protein